MIMPSFQQQRRNSIISNIALIAFVTTTTMMTMTMTMMSSVVVQGFTTTTRITSPFVGINQSKARNAITVSLNQKLKLNQVAGRGDNEKKSIADLFSSIQSSIQEEMASMSSSKSSNQLPETPSPSSSSTVSLGSTFSLGKEDEEGSTTTTTTTTTGTFSMGNNGTFSMGKDPSESETSSSPVNDFLSNSMNSVTNFFSSTLENVQDGELGSRGEAYFVLQMTLVLCILFGEIPFIGDFVSFLLGPGLLTLGASLMALGIAELGSSNLTPWPSPAKNSSLITNGLVFDEIRHPIYAGLLFSMFGVSMWSGSAMRVLLCVALSSLLDVKTDVEEVELVEKFGDDYVDYRERVKSKFIPHRLTEGVEGFFNAFTKGSGSDGGSGTIMMVSKNDD